MPADISLTRKILPIFGNASGLMCNITKSDIFLICCDNVNLSTLLQQFLVLVRQFPCTYLGLPLHFKNISHADIQPVMDGSNSPSFGGHLGLIWCSPCCQMKAHLCGNALGAFWYFHHEDWGCQVIYKAAAYCCTGLGDFFSPLGVFFRT